MNCSPIKQISDPRDSIIFNFADLVSGQKHSNVQHICPRPTHPLPLLPLRLLVADPSDRDLLFACLTCATVFARMSPDNKRDLMHLLGPGGVESAVQVWRAKMRSNRP